MSDEGKQPQIYLKERSTRIAFNFGRSANQRFHCKFSLSCSKSHPIPFLHTDVCTLNYTLAFITHRAQQTPKDRRANIQLIPSPAELQNVHFTNCRNNLQTIFSQASCILRFAELHQLVNRLVTIC